MDFIPLTTSDDMAQLEADKQEYLRKQQLAQALLQSGYTPNSGKMGVLTSVLSSLGGAIMQRRNNESVSDLLKRSFQVQNQQAIAKRQQEIDDENRKVENAIRQSVGSKRGELQAEKEIGKRQIEGGMMINPYTGQAEPIPGYMDQQLALDRGKAQIAAANRQGPADPFAKERAALNAGIITQDQFNAAVQHSLLGAGQNAPSGYRAKADGSLEPIPGGPADPNSATKPKIPADMAGKVALADEYQQNFPGIEKDIQAGELTGPIDSTMAKAGYGRKGEVYRQIQAGQDALQRTLTGAGMPASEASLYASRYLPQTTDTAETLLSKQRQLKKELENFTNIARGNSNAPAQQPAQASGAAVGQVVTGRDGKKYRITGGDPADPDVEPIP